MFVLMPFGGDFLDIYKFGIKGAPEDIGAYAERVDEQMYDEGSLERIFNQINKADIVVADMTGRNPNVFYEVGYAHALNKVVVLLTQKAYRIPTPLPPIPPGALEQISVSLVPEEPNVNWPKAASFCLRLHTKQGPLNFLFLIEFASDPDMDSNCSCLSPARNGPAQVGPAPLRDAVARVRETHCTPGGE
ncbi:MAG: hypothetical protein IH977_04040 [Nitrospinae bacterium]|nr:hypothetical protein [Nitrospinota bacterium]